MPGEHEYRCTSRSDSFGLCGRYDRQWAKNTRNGNGRDSIMTSKQLETITDHLDKLHGYAYFRPQPGPLMERLTQAVLDAVEGELAEQLSEGAFDLEVSIGRQEDESETMVSFSVDYPGVVHSSQLAVSVLADDALEDLTGYLAGLAEAAPAETEADGKTLVRKKIIEGDHHEKGPASTRLKVSPEWLKSVVPCTDYSYDEIDGKKFIREYFWSKELIERLFKIKCTKTTPEDLEYVAKECCEGDQDWARDLIARLKSPNRPEPVAKEQSQKPQSRPAQSHNRPAQHQNRPTQNQNRQATSQSKPAANQSKPAATQNNPAANQGGPAPAKVVPSERSRQRSRHKKPFREQGKDAAGKPESAGQKEQ